LPYEKVGKNEPVCIADEVPFDIPDSWEWVRLGTIGETNIGLTYRPSDITQKGIAVLRSNNIQNGMINYDNLILVDCEIPERAYTRKGDILICARNGSRALVGKSAIVNTDGMAFGAFMAIFRSICNPYIHLFINSYLFRKQLDGAKTTTINQVTQTMLKKQLCPLPPIEEQKRIVEKYHQLQPYIEKYEKAETQLTELNTTFPEHLKKSILQQAVQGKLVPQDPNDEPASILLERIRTEKQKLIKEGKIKKDKHESFIFKRDNSHYERQGNIERCIDDEIPFDIPNSWEWVRLKELAIKEIKRGKSPKYADNGSVYVFAQKCNVKLGGIDMSLAKLLDMKILEKYPVEEYMLDEDIIINSTGNGTLGRIGMFHDTDRINDFIIVPDSHVTIIRACNRLEKNYLFYTLKYYQPYLEKLGEGSTNQTELRPSTIAELFIPIPPIEEQKRIVQRANFLIESCNSL
jgi:type I restriction enzyme S subunit